MSDKVRQTQSEAFGLVSNKNKEFQLFYLANDSAISAIFVLRFKNEAYSEYFHSLPTVPTFPTIARSRRSCLRFQRFLRQLSRVLPTPTPTVPTFPTIALEGLAYGSNVSYVSYDSSRGLSFLASGANVSYVSYDSTSSEVSIFLPTHTYGANVSYVSFWSRAEHCTTYVRERTRVHVREIRFGDLRTSKTQITYVYAYGEQNVGFANVSIQICWGILQLSRKMLQIQNQNILFTYDPMT